MQRSKNGLPLILPNENGKRDNDDILLLLEKSAALGFSKVRIDGFGFRLFFAFLNAIALAAMNTPLIPLIIWFVAVIASQFIEWKLGKISINNGEDVQKRNNFYNAALLSATTYSSVAPIGWFMGNEWAKMCVIWFILGSIVAIAGVQHRVPSMKAKLIAPYIITMPILGAIELALNWNTNNLPIFALSIMFFTGSAFILVMLRVNFTSSKVLNEVFKENEIARIKAEKANILKSQFVSSISHDLRNPLNAILGSAILLKRSIKTEEENQLLDTLLQSGQGMIGLLNDILDHAKLESGKIEFEKTAICPKIFLNEIINSWQAAAEVKKIGLVVSIDENLPKAILGDKQRLAQIVNNLISNAIKFTNHGRVYVSSKIENNKWFISLQDTGIGIDENEIDNLFQPFVQVGNNISSRFGGTGLGLSNSKNLAIAMGGDIFVKSAPNIGSEFWVELPFEIANEKLIENLNQNEDFEAQNYEENPIKILAADDNAANLFIIGKFLETIGANIDLVNDGQEALKKAAINSYDVILLDVRMPIMDGLTACKKIRKESALNKNTPIIMISADAEKDQIAIGLKAGADTYLPKPIVPNKLFEIIETALKGREAFSKAA